MFTLCLSHFNFLVHSAKNWHARPASLAVLAFSCCRAVAKTVVPCAAFMSLCDVQAKKMTLGAQMTWCKRYAPEVRLFKFLQSLI